ncbi:hypothetical protein SK128_011792 [Halocaridina rubra]|uniref:Uncharacterized protein n=1 Tax=Halocaridina rubra TaxID=373956 RepID=A0AAN8XG83_HALRR
MTSPQHQITPCPHPSHLVFVSSWSSSPSQLCWKHIMENHYLNCAAACIRLCYDGPHSFFPISLSTHDSFSSCWTGPTTLSVFIEEDIPLPNIAKMREEGSVLEKSSVDPDVMHP